MNREIKFRCYDKTIKIIRNDISLEFQKPFDGISDGIYPFARFDEVELMQFTGLKDKNGTEIYEGDILRNLGEHLELSNYAIPTKIGYVIFNKERAEFGIQITNLEEPWNNYYSLYAVSNHRNGIEVIGNTYENCGLLKES